MKEAELAQIIFRTRLMIKQMELSKQKKSDRMAPKLMESKVRNDEEYFPEHPEHPRRKLVKIAQKSKHSNHRRIIIRNINEGLSNV